MIADVHRQYRTPDAGHAWLGPAVRRVYRHPRPDPLRLGALRPLRQGALILASVAGSPALP